MTDAGVESMLDFICVSRIGLHGMLMCCVVLCVVSAVSFCSIPTSMFRGAYSRGNIEVCMKWVNKFIAPSVRLHISPSGGVPPLPPFVANSFLCSIKSCRRRRCSDGSVSSCNSQWRSHSGGNSTRSSHNAQESE